MKNRIIMAVLIVVVVFILLIINAVGSKPPDDSAQTQTPSGSPPATNTMPETPPDETTPPETSPPAEATPEPPPPDVKLVAYNGVVEHLFFHEVIAYPQLAFDGDYKQQGYDDNMVTVSEYNKILDSLYDKNYILVNMNDVWSEYTDENGVTRMKANTLMLPEGKKPLILSFDDISFYQYMSDDGFMRKLIVGDDGKIWATGIDPDGNPVVTRDLTVVTILDKFIEQHPDFSLGGVKGCIALTGYEGILGYRTQTDKDDITTAYETNRQKEIALVRPVIKKLKETGWYFASHSWGHIGLDDTSHERVIADADRWQNEVASLIGETQLFIYPFGSRLDGNDVSNTGPAFRYYHSLGFRIFASVGKEPYSKIKSDISAVICDRMPVDGIALRTKRERFMRFYDAAEVMDPLRP